MTGSGWAPLWWFGAIVVLIPVALWLLKRTPLGGAGSGAMRSVAVLPLSASQRIVTIEVGSGAARRWLVLGVSPQHIATLHTMEPQPEMPPAPGEAGTPFAQLLGRMRGGQ